MKKAYITPDILKYKVAIRPLMTGSETTVNVSSENYVEGSMTDLSRRSDSLWDDDDEETVY